MTALLSAALGLLLQSTVLLLLGLLALWLARRRGPAVQSLVGRATLAGVGLALLLAAPLTGHVRPLWRVTLPAAPPVGVGYLRPEKMAPPAPNSGGAGGERAEVPPSSSPTPPELGAGGRSLSPAEAHPPAAVSPAPPPPLDSPAPAPQPSPLRLLYPALAAIWGLGTARLLLWLGVCQWHLSRLCRQAQLVTSGPAAAMLAALTPRPPRLLCHPSVQSPFLAGLRHPALFLPAAYEAEFSPTALRAILAHELAHLARRDTAWTLAARLLSALLWPQPLLWVLCRRLEQIGEEACDQAVLAQYCPPRAYADCLLTLAERHPLPRRERALGAGVAPFRSSLGQRIGRILDKGTHAMSTISTRLRLTVAALTLAAALGGAFLVSSAPAQSPAPDKAALTPEQQRFRAMQTQDVMNLKEIALAITQYTQDHKEHFPDADHWMDQITPYLEGRPAFFDPFKPGAKHYAYALNRNCSKKPLSAFDSPSETVAVFDSTLGTRNASDTGQSLRRIKRPSDSSAFSGYAFVDGHAKWFRQGIRPSFSLKGGRPTVSGMVMAEMTRALRQVEWQRLSENARSTGTTPTGSEALSQARFLAGLTPVQGPGVVVTLNDSKRHLSGKLPPGMAPPNIIHDTDVNQVVNELKAAGAEAVAINDQRLVAVSPIRGVGPTIMVNFIPQAPPFVIKAIGSSKAMTTAMNLPGGVAGQIRSYDPAMFSVREAGTLTLPAYSGTGEPRYAKPISAASANDARKKREEALRNLIQRRDQQKERLADINAQAASLTSLILAGREQTQKRVRKLMPPTLRGAGMPNATDIERRTLATEIAATQVNIDEKIASGMTPQHPAVLLAQRRLQALEQEYQHLAIKEKYQFAQEVHQYVRQQKAIISGMGGANEAAARQLINVQRAQMLSRTIITALNGAIAQLSASPAAH